MVVDIGITEISLDITRDNRNKDLLLTEGRFQIVGTKLIFKGTFVHKLYCHILL